MRDTLAELAVMAESADAERERLLERFIADRRKLFRLMAHRLCRTLGIPSVLHREDVEQLVVLEAVAWVDELLEQPEWINHIATWEGLLQVRARAAVQAWVERTLSPGAGMVSVTRRVQLLNQMREGLREELWAAAGRDPSDLEVELEHYRRLAASRAEAARQGLPAVGEEPILPAHAVDLSGVDTGAVDLFAVERHSTALEEGMLHPVMGPALVRAVIARARAIGGVTAEVARVWLSGIHLPEEARRLLTHGEVAEQLDLPLSSAAAQVSKVRALAQRVVADDFGFDQG